MFSHHIHIEPQRLAPHPYHFAFVRKPSSSAHAAVFHIVNGALKHSGG
jgi:hypothetical protein